MNRLGTGVYVDLHPVNRDPTSPLLLNAPALYRLPY
jgi:hypothetical protein